MRVKVDEDLPQAVTTQLRAADHDARTIPEQDMGGWKDHELWPVVQREGRFFITGDKGFADIRAYPPGQHAGVLLLRPDQDGIRPLVELLGSVLSSTTLESLRETVAVASPQGLRIRR